MPATTGLRPCLRAVRRNTPTVLHVHCHASTGQEEQLCNHLQISFFFPFCFFSLSFSSLLFFLSVRHRNASKTRKSHLGVLFLCYSSSSHLPRNFPHLSCRGGSWKRRRKTLTSRSMSNIPPTSRSTSLLIVNIFFCVIAGITVMARCYTRAVLVKAIGPDDWIMVLATMFFVAYCISSNCGVMRGTGHHMKDLNKDDISQAMEYWWFCYLFFSLTMIACKLSFAWFLLRITTQKLHSIIVYCASMCTVLAGLAFFFVTLFQCQPISYYWDKEQKGTCVDMNIIMALAYVYSIFSVLTDFSFAILPAFIIWNLKLEKKARIAVIFLVCMGCFASTAVAVRCVYLPNFVDPDFLWATTNIAIWSTVEMGLSITTASMATLRPMVKRLRWKMGLCTQGTTKLTSPSKLHRSRSGIKPGNSFSQHNASDEAIYITSDIVLADGVCARADEEQGMGVHVTAYAAPQRAT